MAKAKRHYRCQACGAAAIRWSGQCSACGAWNTLVEEQEPETRPGGLGRGRAAPVTLMPLDTALAPPSRQPTGMAECDRALGGGLVAGAALLLGGDPGIGKSTLLLQLCAGLASDITTVYLSGEESASQVQLRAERLALAHAPVQLATATSVRDIAAIMAELPGRSLVVIDSIQTMFVDSLDAAPGTVSQVRSSATELIRVAKQRDLALVLVGHVTKEGQIAGPRVLEHMVDTVLYFEGERNHQYRLLRAVKNRFGAAGEVGVFAMGARGLKEVANPSALFLSHREEPASGTAVYAGIEGTRPVLLEMEALVAPSHYATPRRAVVGWESGRLAMLLAVLEARAGLVLADQEIYLNVAGGYRIADPAADLTAAAALLSAWRDRPLPPKTVLCGELGLSGEVRPVPQLALRLREAAKLGFTRAVIPKAEDTGPSGLKLEPISHIQALTELW